jgi:hypothetical protein
MKSSTTFLLLSLVNANTSNLSGHHWHHGMNPGMMLNVQGDDAQLIRTYCTFFLPHVLSSQFGWRPRWYEATIADPFGDPFGLGGTRIEWSDINYEITDVEFDEVKFSIESDIDGQVVIDFPAFKDFELSASQAIHAWWFPEWLLAKETEVHLSIKDLDIDFKG